VNKIAAIVQLVEMPWSGEVELAAGLDDGAIVLVDRWYIDERKGHVDASTFPSLIGADIQDLQARVHQKDVAGSGRGCDRAGA